MPSKGATMEYGLDIAIGPEGISQIYAANQRVCIARSVASSPNNLPIVWIAFLPLVVNAVSWRQDYYIYSTTTVLQEGATIVETSRTSTPVQPGWTYTFADGQFTGATGGSPGAYHVYNGARTGSYSFGLALPAAVNGVSLAAPLNAIPILYNQTGAFTPEVQVAIFLSSFENNGVVIGQVDSSALTLTLTSQSPTARIGFNDSTNTFFLEGPAITSRRELAKRLRAT